MAPHLQNNPKLLIIIFIFFLLGSCQVSGGNSQSAPSTFTSNTTPPVKSPSPIESSPTELTVGLPTADRMIATSLSSLTPTKGDILPVEPRTMTPEPTKTPTPSPTLSSEERDRLVLELLKTNQGCRLPCWWGFTPGETRWDEALPLLSRLGRIYMRTDQINQPLLDATVKISVSTEIGTSLLQQTYSFDNYGGGIIRIVRIEAVTRDDYTLASLLRDYGTPEQVYIQSIQVGGGNKTPFLVVVFYPKLGILAKYYADSPRSDPIEGCPQKAHSPFLYLWSPKTHLTFDDIAKEDAHFYSAYGLTYKQLEDATILDPSLFYQIFKDPYTTQCLETPLKLWK